MRLIEVQVDRLVGPTHHFGGLGVGNLASAGHAGRVSNPAAAAIQGLDKMRLVASLGAPQIILPPQRRPDISFLNSLGFDGTVDKVLGDALREAPTELSAAMSCSAMWTANAATVAPAVDSLSGLLTMTTANLGGSLHRSIEPPQTTVDLQRVFSKLATIHPALPGGSAMRDEGAANHIRLGTADNVPGIHLFVHGDGEPRPRRFWPRQSLAACRAIVRRLGIDPANVFFLKQNPLALDAGAFHNDVVAASHENLLLYHAQAFDDAGDQLRQIADRYRALCHRDLTLLEVPEAAISIGDAVETYLFNSQIISSADRSIPPLLICPSQVESHPQARRIVQSWLDDQALFSEVRFVDLEQSMAGGGGPACLRLRVPIAEDQVHLLPPDMLWSERLDDSLRDLIKKHYPTTVSMATLADQAFAQSAERAAAMVRGAYRGV